MSIAKATETSSSTDMHHDGNTHTDTAPVLAVVAMARSSSVPPPEKPLIPDVKSESSDSTEYSKFPRSDSTPHPKARYAIGPVSQMLMICTQVEVKPASALVFGPSMLKKREVPSPAAVDTAV